MIGTQIRKTTFKIAVVHGGPGACGSVACIAKELSKTYGKGAFTEGDRVLLHALHAKLIKNKKLASMAKTSEPQIFSESIFPKAFSDAVQDSYIES